MIESIPTIVKYRAIAINKIFDWEIEFLTIKHHYALKKELTSDICLHPLKIHMQLSFNFENDDENNNASNHSDSANNDHNNNNNNSNANNNGNNNGNHNNGNGEEGKDECDIRLWLVIDHENERLNKHASFDFGVQYLRRRLPSMLGSPPIYTNPIGMHERSVSGYNHSHAPYRHHMHPSSHLYPAPGTVANGSNNNNGNNNNNNNNNNSNNHNSHRHAHSHSFNASNNASSSQSAASSSTSTNNNSPVHHGHHSQSGMMHDHHHHHHHLAPHVHATHPSNMENMTGLHARNGHRHSHSHHSMHSARRSPTAVSSYLANAGSGNNANNNNESIWSELNAKQSHCASGSMWGFQIGKSLNDLKKYCLPKEDKMLFRFDVEFITKCESQVGYHQIEELESSQKFAHRIDDMWKNGLFTDVTIECPAHLCNGNCRFCEDYNEMKPVHDHDFSDPYTAPLLAADRYDAYNGMNCRRRFNKKTTKSIKQKKINKSSHRQSNINNESNSNQVNTGDPQRNPDNNNIGNVAEAETDEPNNHETDNDMSNNNEANQHNSEESKVNEVSGASKSRPMCKTKPSVNMSINNADDFNDVAEDGDEEEEDDDMDPSRHHHNNSNGNHNHGNTEIISVLEVSKNEDSDVDDNNNNNNNNQRNKRQHRKNNAKECYDDEEFDEYDTEHDANCNRNCSHRRHENSEHYNRPCADCEHEHRNSNAYSNHRHHCQRGNGNGSNYAHGGNTRCNTNNNNSGNHHVRRNKRGHGANRDSCLDDGVLETYSISAHKSVLATISSVFYAMLSSHLKERDENHIVIHDLCYNTMYHLLTYAYSNHVSNDCDLKALFAAAEKYQVYDLCHVCLERMENLISVETVCDLLVFVQRYQDNHHISSDLMKKFETNLFEFMVEHYPQISKLECYHRLKAKIESKLTMFMYTKQFGPIK